MISTDARCPECLRRTEDAQCGASCEATTAVPAPAQTAYLQHAYTHRALSIGTSPKDSLAAAACGRRWERIGELVPQAKGLLEQGYHRLPPPPGQSIGPADDLGDMCREIGESYYRNGEYEQAVRWCGEALAVNSANVPARCFLVSALCYIGEHDLAREWYAGTPGDLIDRNVVRSWLEHPEIGISPLPLDPS